MSAPLWFLAMHQRRKEQEIAGAVAHVRRMIDDGDRIAPALADAVRLPVPVLALPSNAGRFWALYSDAIA